MKDAVMHPLTRRQLEALIQTPSQAILLMGPTGSGKAMLATNLAETVLELPANSFAQYPYGTTVRPLEGKPIGIEAVRELEHFLSLKVPKQTAYNRAVIIEDSHLLTTEAQNALLKTLEEPPAGTMVILTAGHDRALLPTIRSRAQSVAVRRPGRALLETHFKTLGFEPEAIQQTYAISGGLPGLMHALLHETDHPLQAAIEQARQLVSQSVHERLLLVDGLARQPALAQDTVAILQQMAHVSLQTASGQAAKRWQAILRASYGAAEALQANAQLKLALTNLVLQF